MSENEISKETVSKIEHQLKVAKETDPTGLVKEFLDLSHGKVPATKYESNLNQSQCFVKTKDGKLELEISNPFNEKRLYSSSEATPTLTKLDKNGQPEMRVLFNSTGNVSATYEYHAHQMDVKTYAMQSGKEKVVSTTNYTFFSDGSSDTIYTDLEHGKRPERFHTAPNGLQSIR